MTTSMMEAVDYRRSMRRFLRAARADPDLLIDVDLPEDAVVLDVGAFQGEWARRILNRAVDRGPAALHIHAFEPAPGAIDDFQAECADDPNVALHPYGLAGRDRKESMSVSGAGSSVFLDPGDPRTMGVCEIKLRDVDSALAGLGVERIDLAKINIEGGEFELLDRLYETGWLSRTGTLIVQFHEFGPHAYRGRRRNRSQLSRTHQCTWCYPWVYERWDPR